MDVRILIAIAVLLCARIAWATPEATQLFREGQELMRSRDFEAACDRFERSARLERRVGTLLNLGDCYENRGKLASAWSTFDEASALARQTRDARGVEATRRAGLLKPRLPYLTIVVEASIPQLTVRKNGLELAAAAWNVAIAVDPGSYVIEATASGYVPWTSPVDIAATERKQVTVALVAEQRSEVHVERPQRATPALSETPLRDAGVGILAGSNTRERPLIGGMAIGNLKVPGGTLRGVLSAIYSRYEDNVSPDPLVEELVTVQTFYVNAGVDYLWLPIAAVGLGGGVGVGIELDHDAMSGNDLGSALQLRGAAVGRLRNGHVEAGLHVQLAFAGTEVTLHGLVGVAWFP